MLAICSSERRGRIRSARKGGPYRITRIIGNGGMGVFTFRLHHGHKPEPRRLHVYHAGRSRFLYRAVICSNTAFPNPGIGELIVIAKVPPGSQYGRFNLGEKNGIPPETRVACYDVIHVAPCPCRPVT